MLLGQKGQSDPCTQAHAPNFQTVQAYDFPQMGSSCARASQSQLEEPWLLELQSFMPLQNHHSNKSSKPTHFYTIWSLADLCVPLLWDVSHSLLPCNNPAVVTTSCFAVLLFQCWGKCPNLGHYSKKWRITPQSTLNLQ